MCIHSIPLSSFRLRLLIMYSCAHAVFIISTKHMHYAHSHFVNFSPVEGVSRLYALKVLTIMNLLKNYVFLPPLTVLLQDPNITATLASPWPSSFHNMLQNYSFGKLEQACQCFSNMKAFVDNAPGQWGQQESCVLIGLWQSRGGHTSVSQSTRPLWQVHWVQESMFHVSPSTKYSPPGAKHTDASLSSGLWELDSSERDNK